MFNDIKDYQHVQIPANQAQPGDFFAFHERNPRSSYEYGDFGHLVKEGVPYIPTDARLKRDIVDALVEFGGWCPTQAIDVQAITEEDAKEAVTRLGTFYERLKTECAEKGEYEKLLVFKHDHVKADGSIKVPKWEVITGNRRFSQLLEIRARLLKIAKGELDELFKFIPARYPKTADKRYVHEDHRLVVANRENRIKTLGYKPMSKFDTLRTVYKLVVNGGRSDGWMEKNMGIKGTPRVEMGGWAHFLQYCEQEMDWGFRLWDRINPFNQFKRNPEGQHIKEGDELVPNPDFIDLTLFKQAAWQGPTGKDHPYKDVAMGPMTDLTKDLDKFNEKRAGKHPAVTRPTSRTYVERWIDFWKSGEGNKDARHKMMDQSEVENIKNGSPLRIARKIAGAIYTRDNSALANLADRASVYNFVHDCTDKVYTALDVLLTTVRRAEYSEDEQVGLFEALTDAVKTFNETKVS